MALENTSPRRFNIALSFPGEHREFVEQVANHLAATFTKERVLYDHYHKAEFARSDLDIYLPDLYRTQAELIVLFLCSEYATKRWCLLEWRFIRQILATLDAKRIMFLSFGNPGDLSGLGILSGDGYLDIGSSDSKEITEEIIKRFRLNQGIKSSQWQRITFRQSRDLGPALMGRGLLPSDITACPRLIETDVIVQQLKRAYSARLVGDPGSGKSVCAYQVAQTFAHQDWSVVCLSYPYVESLSLDSPDGKPTLFLIDDAHLMAHTILRDVEDQAGLTKLLLTVHTTLHRTEAHRGSISIDPKRAVQTIASKLKQNLSETLAVVKRIDDRIGEGSFDEDIRRRIDDAEENSKIPWQLCFILGGGWRRANEAADASRVQGSDLILAIAAAQQLASRDAVTSPEIMLRLGLLGGLTAEEIQNGLAWLVRERLLLSELDLRCPHQRFSSAIIGKIYSGMDSAKRKAFIQVCRKIIIDPASTLAGVRVLIHELWLSSSHLRWGDELKPHQWINEETQADLISKCWSAYTAEDRMFACLVLAEIGGHDNNWEHLITGKGVEQLAKWLSEAVHPMGYGLSRLLNDIYNDDKSFAAKIVSAADPVKLAWLVSAVTPMAAYTIGEMLNRIALVCSEEWKQAFNATLQCDQILRTIEEWPGGEYIGEFSKFCGAVSLFNREFAFAMLKAAMPLLQHALAFDTLDAFIQIEDDILWLLLRVWHPLANCTGKNAPDRQQFALAREICREVDCAKVAEKISSIALREFRQAAFFLSFFRRVDQKKAATLCRKLDWERLDKTIGEGWSHLSHDLTTFICQVSADKQSREKAVSVIETHRQEIKVLPSRIAILAPELACSVIDQNGVIAIGEDMALHWQLAAYVIQILGELRPELIGRLIGPHATKAAKSLQSKQLNIYDDADIFLRILEKFAPDALLQILSILEAKSVKDAWAFCLSKGGKPGRTTAILVEHCLAMPGELGEVAKCLRRRFPKTSIPK